MAFRRVAPLIFHCWSLIPYDPESFVGLSNILFSFRLSLLVREAAGLFFDSALIPRSFFSSPSPPSVHFPPPGLVFLFLLGQSRPLGHLKTPLQVTFLSGLISKGPFSRCGPLRLSLGDVP